MKLSGIITVALSAVLLTSGCDFCRSLVGKPTSAQLEALKTEKEARDKAVRDSIAAARAEAERIAAEEAAQAAAKQYKRYYVIVGSFMQPDNAIGMRTQMEKLGYEMTEFTFKNGFKAVGLFGTDSVREAYDKMNSLFSVECTPYDLWVYDTATNLHE